MTYQELAVMVVGFGGSVVLLFLLLMGWWKDRDK